MSKTRIFIKETINALTNRAAQIDIIWDLFQKGKITKEVFEERYKQLIYWVIDNIKDELQGANNGCKYSVTNPDCEYFNTMNI